MAKLTTTDKMVRELANNAPDFAALDHDAANFSGNYAKALNWVHYNVDHTELKTELTQMLTDRKAEDLVPYVADLDGVTFGTLGKIAYCINRGAKLAPASVLRIRTALEKVMSSTSQQVTAPAQDFEQQEVTPAGRVNDIYKNCYSRIDNVKARVLNSKIELKAVQGEVEAILDTQGAKAQVRKRLMDHYTQNLNEALADKVLKAWVKPLQEILRVLGGDVQEVKAKAKKVEAKVKVNTAKRLAKEVVSKAAKPKATKPKAAKTKVTRTVTIKPKSTTGAPTIASQVRDLIKANKNSTTEQGMMEIVIRELGLSKERSRSVVKAFWNKVEA